MSQSQYFYTQLTVTDLEKLVHHFQEEFETLLKDLFSDDELATHERSIDTIAAVFVQPILSELSFDDFYPDEDLEQEQKTFFESCKSSICLENLPYFQSNPFQVSYLIQLLSKIGEVLIDLGGVSELVFKEKYLLNIKKYKTIDHLLGVNAETTPSSNKPFIPVHQIDFFVMDVYKEIERLRREGKLETIEMPSEKRMKLLNLIKAQKLHSEELMRKSGLGAKEFDDNMESLKFFLKKI
ncbi:MAG: hypothetical protein ACOVP4_11520 [Bacteriovoracaceae bacterium]